MATDENGQRGFARSRRCPGSNRLFLLLHRWLGEFNFCIFHKSYPDFFINPIFIQRCSMPAWHPGHHGVSTASCCHRQGLSPVLGRHQSVAGCCAGEYSPWHKCHVCRRNGPTQSSAGERRNETCCGLSAELEGGIWGMVWRSESWWASVEVTCSPSPCPSAER